MKEAGRKKSPRFLFPGWVHQQGRFASHPRREKERAVNKGVGKFERTRNPNTWWHFHAVATFFRRRTTTPDRDLSVHSGGEMLPNFANSDTATDFKWAGDRHEIFIYDRAPVDKKICRFTTLRPTCACCARDSRTLTLLGAGTMMG